jgi:DNA-binding NtrC family response regulator
MKKVFYFGRNHKEYDSLRLELFKRFQFYMGDDPARLLNHLDIHSPQIVVFDATEFSDVCISLLPSILGHPVKPVLILTGCNIPQMIMVHALKSGVLDIMPTPIDPIAFRNRIMNHFLLESESGELLPGVHPAASRIIGETPSLVSLKSKISLLSQSREPVVISGESGTGRALFARVIHDAGEGSARPFIRLNGGRLWESLTGDFFQQDPFTVPRNLERPLNIAEITGSGTLFIENLEEMPRDQQYSLLRLLEEGTLISRITGEKIPFQGRILCSCGMEMKKGVETGLFRQELFTRLNVLAIAMPPLRTRELDIALISAAFIGRQGKKTGLSPDGLSKLTAHNWPGNVRELEKVLKRALVFAGKVGVLSANSIDLN